MRLIPFGSLVLCCWIPLHAGSSAAIIAHAEAQASQVTRSIYLPDVDLTDANGKPTGVLLACRIPIFTSAAIFIDDDSTKMILGAMSMRGSIGHDVTKEKIRATQLSNWIFWPLNTTRHDLVADAISPPPPNLHHARIVLNIIGDSSIPITGEFGTTRDLRPSSLSFSSAEPVPVSLGQGNMQFHYRIDADANVNIEILPIESGYGRNDTPPVFTDHKTDIPAGVRSYPYDLRDNHGKLLSPGPYFVRFRCRARNTNRSVNDICLPFRIVP